VTTTTREIAGDEIIIQATLCVSRQRLHWVCTTLVRMRRPVNAMLPASTVATAAFLTAWAS